MKNLSGRNNVEKGYPSDSHDTKEIELKSACREHYKWQN